jgi:hypothetical protein
MSRGRVHGNIIEGRLTGVTPAIRSKLRLNLGKALGAVPPYVRHHFSASRPAEILVPGRPSRNLFSRVNVLGTRVSILRRVEHTDPVRIRFGKTRPVDGLREQMAAHELPRTTPMYDRRDDEVAADEVERVLI